MSYANYQFMRRNVQTCSTLRTKPTKLTHLDTPACSRSFRSFRLHFSEFPSSTAPISNIFELSDSWQTIVLLLCYTGELRKTFQSSPYFWHYRVDSHILVIYLEILAPVRQFSINLNFQFSSKAFLRRRFT